MFDFLNRLDVLPPCGVIIFIGGLLLHLVAFIGLFRSLFGGANPKIDERFAIFLFGGLLLLISAAWLGRPAITGVNSQPLYYSRMFTVVTLHSLTLIAGIGPFLIGVFLLLRTLTNTADEASSRLSRWKWKAYVQVFCLATGSAMLFLSVIDVLDSMLFLQTLVTWSM